MKNRLRRAFLLTLSLLLCLLPPCAGAEELPSADHLNMTSVSVRNIRYDDGTGEQPLPMTLDITMGADLPARRAMALVSLNAGNAPITFMGSVEQDEIRARLSGLETGLAMPLHTAEEEIIRSSLLLGLQDDEISEETRAALDEYLALLEQSMLLPAGVLDSRNIIESMYPIDLWREEYEKYPSLLNAVPAGEEEITLFGQTYTARKYTYSLENATDEDFAAFYEAYDSYYHGVTGELDAAYERLMELVYADYTAKMEKEDVWKDNGASEGSEKGSLSEWDEAQQPGYLYNIEGTIWQVDEILGQLEQYTATALGPDGEYTTSYTYSDMLTDSLVRYESALTEEDSYCTYTSADSMSLETDETGRIVMEKTALTHAAYPGEDYAAGARMTSRAEMTGSSLLLSLSETMTGSGQTEQLMEMNADFALGTEEATGLLNRASGPLSFSMNMLGQKFSAAMDLEILLSTLPEGELLPMNIETINPFEADEETMAQFTSELEALLLRTFGSFIPAPETPPSVGGALLG